MVQLSLTHRLFDACTLQLNTLGHEVHERRDFDGCCKKTNRSCSSKMKAKLIEDYESLASLYVNILTLPLT